MSLRSAILITSSLLLVSAQSTGMRVLEKVFDQCANTDEMFKCLKIQAIKAGNRAVMLKNLNIFDGVSLVSNGNAVRDTSSGRSFNESKLADLESSQLNDIIKETADRFMSSHQLQVKVPELIEEGRKKKNRQGGGGSNPALYWALAIKGTFLAIAYKGIAVMSGLALIMGKMALLLTAILGLKHLVNSGQEQTTFEIVKQPKYSESHTHSTSYEDEGYNHHRLYDAAENSSRRIFRAYI